MEKRSLISSLSLAARFALRELRGGLSGFRVFLACIALGVAAIGAVNSVADGITTAIEREGRNILGADIKYELVQREASDAELATIKAQGTVSYGITMRSMARLPDGSDQSLVEIKAVDGAYPLYGAVKTDSGSRLPDLLSNRNGSFGAVAPQILFDRLGLKVGDHLLVGDLNLELRATLLTEPDVLSEGFGFAPRLMMSREAVEASGLIRTGSLANYNYKVLMNQTLSKPALLDLQKAQRKKMGDSGFRIATSANAAPALADTVERFSQFLSLVALCALLVGGVGVANAVQAHLDGKRSVIATFKSLGAGGGFVATVYLIQILIIALAGIAIGLVISAIVPPLVGSTLERFLPLSIDRSIQTSALVLAALFGFMTTLAFALVPLGRTRHVRPTMLFRDTVSEGSQPIGWRWLLAAMFTMALTAGLVILLSEQRRIAAIFLGAALGAFIILYGVSALVIWAASRVARPQSTIWRLAIGNIYRPGGITRSVVISLGLGLTLLAAISLIDNNLRSQISGSIAGKAPDFFFADIQGKEIDGFSKLLSEISPHGKVQNVPMLRGRITALKGIKIADYKVPPEASWVTRGDRGITYSPSLPDNSSLAQGSWWAADYRGEPLVSFAAEEAGELGLKVGDTVTVNVLGRDITAKIANLRAVEWRSLSINFVMVFSPSMFKGAPHAWLSTLTDPSSDAAGEAKVLNSVTKAFPAITTVRVKDALSMATSFIAQFTLAIRISASVALIASVLVLAGALAAGNRIRVRDAVILKMLGATRRTLVRAFVLEYMLVGLATAVFALLAGTLAAWFVITNIMNLTFSFEPIVLFTTVGIALVLTIGMGLAGTYRILGQKASPVLRTL